MRHAHAQPEKRECRGPRVPSPADSPEIAGAQTQSQLFHESGLMLFIPAQQPGRTPILRLAWAEAALCPAARPRPKTGHPHIFES